MPPQATQEQQRREALRRKVKNDRMKGKREPPGTTLTFFPLSTTDNAVPIKSWFSDPLDTSLLSLLPVLDALRFTADVRSVLSRNLHLHRLW